MLFIEYGVVSPMRKRTTFFRELNPDFLTHDSVVSREWSYPPLLQALKSPCFAVGISIPQCRVLSGFVRTMLPTKIDTRNKNTGSLETQAGQAILF